MATGFEGALVKPIVDGIVALFNKSKGARLKSTAEQSLTEAIRELLLAPSDLRSAEAKIAVAKAAGIINADLILAEEIVEKHKVATKTKAPAKKAAARKAAPKKRTAPAKKTAEKKAALKGP